MPHAVAEPHPEPVAAVDADELSEGHWDWQGLPVKLEDCVGLCVLEGEAVLQPVPEEKRDSEVDSVGDCDCEGLAQYEALWEAQLLLEGLRVAQGEALNVTLPVVQELLQGEGVTQGEGEPEEVGERVCEGLPL